MDVPVVFTEDLRKAFHGKRGEVRAVNGVDLRVEAGEIFGFVGPNGAGKTTTLRILTTLLPPDAGVATVAGFDVKGSPHEVRRRIGYVGQAGGSDRSATGREDLVLQGRLYDMSVRDAKQRAAELIEALDLTEFVDRIVGTYSGGQRRRLDVALGIMHRPLVLFLDEPTIGLDPQNRANLWEQIRELRARGTTIFITTHYMDEADELSDRLAIIDHGVIVAQGTPRELKKQIAGDVLTIGVVDHEKHTEKLAAILSSMDFVRSVSQEPTRLRVYVADGESALPEILRLLDSLEISLSTATLSVPTLDDVFLRETGRSLRPEGLEGA